MKILYTFLTLIIFCSLSHSQVQQEWVQRYNNPPGNPYDRALSLAVDAAGNSFVTGFSLYNNLGVMTTIKYNSAGIQEWVARYDSASIANSIFIDGFDNVFITGASLSNTECTTIKYNSAGNQQWVTNYSLPGDKSDVGKVVKADGVGNVYVLCDGGPTSNGQFITIKYNSSGVQQWVQYYNNPAHFLDYPRDLDIDNNGNVYITGVSAHTTINSSMDYVTIKYNSSGVQQWLAVYNGTADGVDDPSFIKVGVNGNVYVTGYSTDAGFLFGIATIKYNSNGTQQWVSKYLDSTGARQPRGLSIDDSSNVYITGSTYSSSSFIDYATIKYNSSGIQQWVSIYNGPADTLDVPASIVVDKSHDVYVTGTSIGIGTYRDYATVSYTTSGILRWVMRYNGPGDSTDVASSIALDSTGNVYVTGYSFGIGAISNYCTIKYSQPIGIKPISSEIPDRFNLYQNYPNPFNPSTKIKFDLPSVGHRYIYDLHLVVYDALGREVAVLVNESATGGLKPGTYEVEFNGSNFPSGVYFYKLQAETYSATKKMVLVK